MTTSPNRFALHVAASVIAAAAGASLLPAAALAADSVASPAAAEAAAPPAVPLPMEGGASDTALKGEYIECELRAAQVPLDTGSAARCSIVYETLLQRVFEGRYENLAAWWREAIPMP